MLACTNRNTVKWARPDGNDGFIGLRFENQLRQHSIFYEGITAYIPESSRKAERLNCTLMDMEKANLVSAEVHRKDSCAETVNNYCFSKSRFINRTYKESCTPYEVNYGSKPNLAHLQKSGCKASVHMPAQILNTEFDPRSDPGVLPRRSKKDAYRILMISN